MYSLNVLEGLLNKRNKVVVSNIFEM